MHVHVLTGLYSNLEIKRTPQSGIHLEKSPGGGGGGGGGGGKSTSENILGGRAYSGQYSILKGCNSQGGHKVFKGGICPPPPPMKPCQ